MNNEYHKTVIIDIETTGLPPERIVPGKRKGTTKKERLPYDTHYMEYPYIVSMAWKVDDEGTQHYIINQEGREIPKEASDIHGITTEIANDSEYLFGRVIEKFLENSNGSEIVVGHGIYFDTSIIKANVLRVIKEKKENDPADYVFSYNPNLDSYKCIVEILHKHKRIDTMRSTAKIMRKWSTLQELHMKLFRKGFDAHNAKEDVEACYRCYQWLKQKGIVPTWEKLQEKAKESVNG